MYIWFASLLLLERKGDSIITLWETLNKKSILLCKIKTGVVRGCKLCVCMHVTCNAKREQYLLAQNAKLYMNTFDNINYLTFEFSNAKEFGDIV